MLYRVLRIVQNGNKSFSGHPQLLIFSDFYSQGYTIPLDKRLAADGRGLQDPHINDKFAKLAEALYIADRKVELFNYTVIIT